MTVSTQNPKNNAIDAAAITTLKTTRTTDSRGVRSLYFVYIFPLITFGIAGSGINFLKL